MKSGREQFREWMHRRGFNQREAGVHFGWGEATISHILTGRRVPGLVNAVKIERKTGIAVESWLSSRQDKSDAADVRAARNPKLVRA